MATKLTLTKAQRRVIELLAKGKIIFRGRYCSAWTVENHGRVFKDQTIIDLHDYVTYYFDGLRDVLKLTKGGTAYARENGMVTDE